MTIVSNTFTTYSAKGIREDLSNVITNIAPEETPYQSNIGRETISNTLFEWQTDTLADAAANAQLEGDDVGTFDSVVATVRLTNYAQISRKTIVLSNTEEVVNKAGRRSELAYQIAKRGSELKRDQEFIFLNGGIAVAGNTTTARVTASLGAFVKTNTDKQTNGVDPSYTTLPNSARTDGNVRTFTETILKNVIQKVWTAGGTPKILMCGPVNKQRVSGFSGHQFSPQLSACNTRPLGCWQRDATRLASLPCCQSLQSHACWPRSRQSRLDWSGSLSLQYLG